MLLISLIIYQSTSHILQTISQVRSFYEVQTLVWYKLHQLKRAFLDVLNMFQQSNLPGAFQLFKSIKIF